MRFMGEGRRHVEVLLAGLLDRVGGEGEQKLR